MKISVSNITWKEDPKYFPEFLDFISNKGCSGVELAPSLIWKEPIESTPEERKNLVKLVKEKKLEIVGFHSLLFTRPDLKLFLNEESRKDTKNYIKELIKLCSDLGGKQLIFGSPRNRMLHGKKYKDCLDQSIEDFYDIAEDSKKENVIFCIEALGPNDTEFIKSFDESGEIVKKVDHNNFKLHLDTKVIFASKEEPYNLINKYKDLIQHVHVGDEGLKEPGTINFNHSKIGEALRKINYDSYISLEIRRNNNDISGTVNRGINFLKENYIGKV